MNLPCRIYNEDDNTEIFGTTKDLSLHGIAILMEKPYYIDETNRFVAEFTDRDYNARVLVKPVHVDSYNDKWNYSFYITDFLGTYDDYLEIIYDRRPTLPQTIKRDSGSFEDLKVNTTKRLSSPIFAKRHIVRVELDLYADYLETGERSGGVVRIDNFNYEFILIDGEGYPIPKDITIQLTEHIAMSTHYNMDIGRQMLYSIDDVKGIREDPELYEELLDFLMTNSKDARHRNMIVRRERKKEEKRRRTEYFSEISIFSGKESA